MYTQILLIYQDQTEKGFIRKCIINRKKKYHLAFSSDLFFLQYKMCTLSNYNFILGLCLFIIISYTICLQNVKCLYFTIYSKWKNLIELGI